MPIEESIATPALNEITAPFLYMFNNNYIQDHEENDLNTENIIEKFNKTRLNSIAKNIDLFSIENIIQFPSNMSFKDLSNEDSGQLYSIDIKEYVQHLTVSSADKYEHMLFIDITRDGMRLVVPIYKLFAYEDNNLVFNILNITGLIPKIELQANDKFLFIAGDTLRTAMRYLKKNSLLKDRAKLEHAGITGKFSIEQI